MTAAGKADGRQHKPNPWLAVTAADYDGHMREIGQAQALELIFARAYAWFSPKSLAVLGCGTGSGLACVNPETTKRVVCVDLNPDYLRQARLRNPQLKPAAEWMCAPVESLSFRTRSFDMVHAALLFEFVEWRPIVAQMACWLRKGGVFSVVLQLPGGRMISPTRYKTIPLLRSVHRLVAPRELLTCAAKAGLSPAATGEVPLPGGKRFFHAALVRP